MSNELGLIIKNEKAVVSSLDVSLNYEKDHARVLKDIRLLIDQVPQAQGNFALGSYVDLNNQKRPMYLMDRQGFSMLVMGFTGQKAKQFTYKYTQAFEEMSKEIMQSKKLSPMEQLRLQYEVVENHEERLSTLENTMTIDYGQQQELRNLAQSIALEAIGGKNSLVYQARATRTKVFSSIWKDFKDYFQINSYKNTPRKELDKAIEYLRSWKPQGKLQREIEELNNQITM